MGITINEDLLAAAVDRKIRPLLVDQGYLSDLEAEGSHHGKVIPTAQPLLARAALEKDAAGSVVSAISANWKLLSRFEAMQATDFLKQCKPADVKRRTIALLYDEENLVERIRTYMDWCKPRTAKGKTIGMNATVVSYLLAMSDPKRYAFCKPKVYSAAAESLLGEDQVEDDPILRIAHCTEFYAAALELFRSRHKLPFTDLMHCHIAFYVMDYYKDVPPTWDTLAEMPAPAADKTELRETTMQATPLNLILYGPPGTGKTYHTMTRAVAICDGEAPKDRRKLSARFNELRDQGRIEFVTFHQSYGYEEFVEGIRPVLAGRADAAEDTSRTGDLQYECPPGIFKRICDAAKAGSTTAQRTFHLDLAKHRVWKMSLGNTRDPNDGDVYDECIQAKQIRLGYGWHQDFTGCNDRDAVLARLREAKPEIEATDYNVASVDWFKNLMRTGDLVVVSDGNLKFRAIGRVAGNYAHIEADDYDQVRPVEWLLVLEESLAVETILRKAFSQLTLYQLRERVLKIDALSQMLSRKSAAPPLPHVLVIDEINRGNISKLFGELITLIEPDKRLGAENELRATLPYSGERFGVPSNLYLIGTMNTADRSIAFLDTALRRRFRFEEMMPNPQVIRDHVGKNGVVDGIDAAAILEAINRRIELLYDRDHQIGHSYFMGVKSLADLREVFQFQVIPLLQEYFHDDWTKICHVLACPYDGETGKALAKNPLPLIVAMPLDGALARGTEPLDVEPRFRYAANPALKEPQAAALRGCFTALLNGHGTAASGDGDGEE